MINSTDVRMFRKLLSSFVGSDCPQGENMALVNDYGDNNTVWHLLAHEDGLYLAKEVKSEQPENPGTESGICPTDSGGTEAGGDK